MPTKWNMKSLYTFPIVIAVGQLLIALGCFYSGYKFHELAKVTAAHSVAAEQTIREMKCDPVNKEIAIGIAKIQVEDQEYYAKILFAFGQLGFIFSVIAIYEIWRRRVASRLNIALDTDAITRQSI